jgi:hypothetical protein
MKNSLACVIFKEKKSTIFAIILRQLEKWENYKDILHSNVFIAIGLLQAKVALLVATEGEK